MRITNFLLLILVIFFSGCSRSSGKVEFNAFLPLTGELSFLGDPGKIALQIAEEEINANGGIGGRQLQVNYYDTQGNPTMSKILFDRLPKNLYSRSVLSTLSGVSLELAKISGSKYDAKEDKKRILQFVLAIHPDIVKSDYRNIRLCYNAQNEASLLVEAIKKDDPKKIAALISLDAVSKIEYEDYIKPGISKGLKNVDIVEETFNIGQSDFKVIMDRVERYNPDIILVLGYGSDFKIIMETLYKYESLQNKRVFGGIGFIELPDYVDTRKYDNVVFTTPEILIKEQSEWSEKFKKFVSKYKKKCRDCNIPPYDAIYTYESIMLWKYALDSLLIDHNISDITPEMIYDFIVQNVKEYDGISGKIKMDKGDSYLLIKLARYSTINDKKMLIYKE